MNNEQLLNRALGAYLGFACGDALGATVEFMTPRQIQQRYGVHREIIGGGWLALAAGQVTDDTQMSLALGDAIIAKQGWELLAVADNFLTWLHTDPPDVGNTCRRGLLRFQQTGELFGPLREDDAGNGACMRNLPVVLATLQHEDSFAAWSVQQNHLTHNNPLSDVATLALGRMVRRLINGEAMVACEEELQQLLQHSPVFNFTPYPGKSSAYIMDTIQTVLHYFFASEDFESCLVSTVNQGGDADTTGALVGMLAGARFGVDNIPERWISALDQDVVAKIRQQTLALVKLRVGL